jgi:hypothetical protein
MEKEISLQDLAPLDKILKHIAEIAERLLCPDRSEQAKRGHTYRPTTTGTRRKKIE